MGASAVVGMTAAEVLQAVGEVAPQGTATFADWMADQAFKEVVDGVASNMYYDLMSLEENFGTQAAEAAFNEWTTKTATGAAGQSPVTKAAVKTAMKRAGDSGASAAGLLSMSLPAWTAAVAPVLGFAAGYGLYSLNPDLWEKISRTLLPFCYENTDVMPAVVDADGNTYLDKDAIDALRNMLIENGVIDANGNLLRQSGYEKDGKFYPGTTAPGKYPFGTNLYPDGYIQIESGCVLSGRTIYNTTNDIKGVRLLRYAGDPTGGYSTGPIPANSVMEIGMDAVRHITEAAAFTELMRETMDAYKNGTATEKGFDGVSQWTGNTVDYGQMPVSQRYTSATDSTKTKDVIQVALPIDPMQSNDGELFPDPTTNSDPEAAIDPYISTDTSKQSPKESREDPDDKQKTFDPIAPIPYPVPRYQPNPEPDPERDPSKPDGPISKTFDPILYDPHSSGVNNKSPVPDPSAVFSAVAGLISVYNPTPNELIAFSRWLWVTYQDATIDKIWNNPFDGIISLHELYITPTIGPVMNIRSGFLTSDVVSATVPVRYSEINCGTVVVPEFWGNYLDYSPYSKAFCYLPFIGIVELDVDDIVGHAVNIKYRIDAYNGSCIAMIECAQEGYSNQIYQFSGNCSVEVPIAGGSQAAIKAGQMMASAQEHAAAVVGASGILGGLASLLSGRIASGLVEAATAGQIAEARGQAAAIQATVTAKSSVQHSGTFGESFGAMGNKVPYLIIKRPRQVVVPNYNEQYGYPAHKLVAIGSCTGFIRCREVHVISPTATDEEKSLIEQLLKTGVYVTE